MPIVYILTNECMPETIKIGVTDNLEQRIRQLDNTSVALPFECFYAVEVPDAFAIEKKMHQGLDDYRIRQNREFFNTTPENAKSLLEIAELMGGKNITPNEVFAETELDKIALEKVKKVRQRFNFDMLGIEKGTILKFKKDPSITCEVHDDTKVIFRGEVVSLSKSADTVLSELGYDWSAVQGPRWWCIENRTLSELRHEIE